jgi:hypothetical protein
VYINFSDPLISLVSYSTVYGFHSSIKKKSFKWTLLEAPWKRSICLCSEHWVWQVSQEEGSLWSSLLGSGLCVTEVRSLAFPWEAESGLGSRQPWLLQWGREGSRDLAVTPEACCASCDLEYARGEQHGGAVERELLVLPLWHCVTILTFQTSGLLSVKWQ